MVCSPIESEACSLLCMCVYCFPLDLIDLSFAIVVLHGES